MSNGRITQLTTEAPKPSAHTSHATLIAELAAERAKVKKLREALEELLDATGALMPPSESGRAAQDSWAERNDQARINARAALAETAE